MLKTLEEELLEPEERVRLCEIDARQYLEVKPEMAWTRAKQAVSLLGIRGEKLSVTDQTVRDSAYLTLAEVSFALAMRGTRFAKELGHPDLFEEARRAAQFAHRPALAKMMDTVAGIKSEPMAHAAMNLFEDVKEHPQEVEPWFATEMAAHAPEILQSLEASLDTAVLAPVVLPLLPVAYKMYGIVDAEGRYAARRRQAIQMLLASKMPSLALPLIEEDPESTPELKAQCYEEMQNYAAAAELYLSLGKTKEALRNYRSIPEIDKALKLMREMGGEQAGMEGLEWMAQMRRLMEKRPGNFARTATAAEKQMLTALLEAQLDGPRAKKPAKPRAPRKTAGKTAAKTPAKPRAKRNDTDPNKWF